MREIDDGGPAFPCDWVDFQPTTGEQVIRLQHSGLSLRDWFAGQALVGLVASPATDHCTFGSVASSAYGYADAMIKARAQ
jgi:hypothetical protein